MTKGQRVAAIALEVVAVVWLLGALLLGSLMLSLGGAHTTLDKGIVYGLAIVVAAAPSLVLWRGGLAKVGLATLVFLAGVVLFFGVCVNGGRIY